MSDRAAPPLTIIGAGPAGLALAMHSTRPTLILEAGETIGGLARSIEFGGAIFDIGGHSFHTHYSDVAQMVEGLMAGNWEVQRRDARVWFDGAMVPYPFQQHLEHIKDKAIARECLDALPADPQAAAGATHFGEWIERRFGSGVARHFLMPL